MQRRKPHLYYRNGFWWLFRSDNLDLNRRANAWVREQENAGK